MITAFMNLPRAVNMDAIYTAKGELAGKQVWNYTVKLTEHRQAFEDRVDRWAEQMRASYELVLGDRHAELFWEAFVEHYKAEE